jgi:hypothetical protein
MRLSIKRILMMVLWPSFLTAALAEGFFFSMFAPDGLVPADEPAFAPMAVYTIAFFLFWSLCALASMLTCYLMMVPDADNPPF